MSDGGDDDRIGDAESDQFPQGTGAQTGDREKAKEPLASFVQHKRPRCNFK